MGTLEDTKVRICILGLVDHSHSGTQPGIRFGGVRHIDVIIKWKRYSMVRPFKNMSLTILDLSTYGIDMAGILKPK